jgi:hypothetical protein
MTQFLTEKTAASFTSKALMLSLLTAVSLPIQAHEILVDGDPGNDWIEGLANSENVPCCGDNDCYPLPAHALQISPAGTFKVEIGGSWFPVPEQNLIRDRSPDGRPWICPMKRSSAAGYLYTIQGVRCLLLPMGV